MRITIISVAAFLLFTTILTSLQTDEGDKLFRDCGNKDFLDADPRGAIPLCERVVREYGTNRPLLAKARLKLGTLYESIGNLTKARENYDELCKLSDQGERSREGCSRLEGLVAPRSMKIVTPYTDDPYSFAISPDATTLVYQARVDGKSQLWIQPVDSSTKAIAIPGTENARQALPFFSPDGKSLGFFAEQRLKRIDLATGVVKDLAPAPGPTGGTWGSTGVILFQDNGLSGPLERVPADGGNVELVPFPCCVNNPTFLPDGRHFLYVAQSGGATAAMLGSLEPDSLNASMPSNARTAVFAAPDQILYVVGTQLLARHLDPKTFQPFGEETIVAKKVGWQLKSASFAAVSASAAGPLAYRADITVERQMVWIDRNGRQTSTLGEPDRESPKNSRVSPDERFILYHRDVSSGIGSVWLIRTADGQSRQWDGLANFPVFSPDGDRLVMGRGRFITGLRGNAGWTNLYIQSINLLDGRPGDWLRIADENNGPQDWSRLNFILYTVGRAAGDLMALPQRGDPIAVAATSARETKGRFSPDGNWVAYVSNQVGGRDEVFLQPFPGSIESRKRVSVEGGNLPQWGRNGRELYFLSEDFHLMVASVTLPNGPGAPEIGVPRPLFPNALRAGSEFSVASDGDRFLVITPVADSPPIYVIPGVSKTNPPAPSR